MQCTAASSSFDLSSSALLIHICIHPNSVQIYAVYGGFFIVLSFLWGWAVDGQRPDTGDWVGSGIAVAGACVAFFWPGR